MDAVRFKEFLVVSSEQNKTIENDTEFLFSYANIHDRSFDDELNDAFTTLDTSVWNTAGASGTWQIVSSQLQGTGDGGADWDLLLSVDDMPSEAVFSVYKNCNRGGIVFRATDANNGYMFYWDANSVCFQKCSGGTWATLVDIPKVYTSAGDVTLSWREIKFGATADYKWLFFSAWMDGELCLSWCDDITLATPGQKIGFAVYDSDTVIFDDARIPELTEVVEWCSMDIGETPGGALGRMIGRRHIKYFLRYDGTLRMWRPKSASSSWTYQRHITGFNWNVDNRNLASHWRQVGAWEQADRLDTTLLQQGIGRFHKDDNADLMTKEACYNEAGYAIQALKEDADRIDMDVPTQVLQEPEDVVTVHFARDGNTIVNNVDYIVDLNSPHTISFDESMKTTLHLRRRQ